MSPPPLPPDQPQWPSASPPLALDYAAPLERPVDLRAIALRQRAVICCILAYVIVAASGPAIPSIPVGAEVLALAHAVLQVVLLIAGLVFAFMLSMAVYRNPAAGVIGGILMFFPLIGLLVLVVINIDAVKIFRRHGVRVGLLGASLRQLPPRTEAPTH